MIVCSCRSISDHDFETEADLIDRIMQPDHKCGTCQFEILKKSSENQMINNHLTNLSAE